MIDEVAEVAEIIGSGVARLFGFRRGERPESFEAGQSIVAAVIVIGFLVAGVALLIYWVSTA